MSGKKLLVIMIVLGLVSFGAAFVVTQMFQEPPEVAKSPKEIRIEKEKQTALAGAELLKLGPRELELEKLIKDLTRKHDLHRRRMRQLDRREQQIKIAVAELKASSAALEAQRIELTAPLVRLKELMDDIRKDRVVIKLEEEEKLRSLAKTFAAMAAESSGSIITSMCTDERIDHAVKIVWYMPDRDRAKLLAAMTNPLARDKLLNKFTKIQQEKG